MTRSWQLRCQTAAPGALRRYAYMIPTWVCRRVSLRRGDHDDAVDVVWHYHEGIWVHLIAQCLGTAPFLCSPPSPRVQIHLSVLNLTE
jgi:hypothetical protein